MGHGAAQGVVGALQELQLLLVLLQGLRIAAWAGRGLHILAWAAVDQEPARRRSARSAGLLTPVRPAATNPWSLAPLWAPREARTMAGQELPQLVAEGCLFLQLPAVLGLGLGLVQLCREKEKARKLSPSTWAGGACSQFPRSGVRPEDSRRSSRSTLMLRPPRRDPDFPRSRRPAPGPRRPSPAARAEGAGRSRAAARGILGAVVGLARGWKRGGGRLPSGALGAAPQRPLG